MELLERKRVFRYYYVNFHSQLDKPVWLPRAALFNKLEGVEYSAVDYAHS